MQSQERFDVPVLFLIFNRPENTRCVFEKIRQTRPGRLFIAADGPRPNKPGENEKCEEARAVIKNIDWDCEIQTLFRETNLGCKKAVSSAISWFFDNVNEGIIVEDDCLPDISFFPYCRELLEKYREDERIMVIGGNNFQFGKKIGEVSYYFSQFPQLWGWASWRRVWKLYDPDMPDYQEFVKIDGFKKVFHYHDLRRYYSVIFKRMFIGKDNTWDYQLFYAILKNSGICIIPNVNLIENIGFTGEGAHYNYTRMNILRKILDGGISKKLMSNVRDSIELPLNHPAFIIPEYEADHDYFKKMIYHPILRIYLYYIEYFT